MKKSWLRKLTKFILFLALCTPAISLAHAANNYAEGEALVVLKNNVGTLSTASLSSAAAMNYIAEVATSASAEAVTTYSELSAACGEIYVLVRSGTKSTEELIAELKKNPNVESASPNYIMFAAATRPNDTLWGNMWNMEMIRAPEAWDISTGNSNIYVAVLDSGIDIDHEDLRPNIDMSLSRNFVNPTGNSSAVINQDYGEKSKSGHGTHIAGTIAAVGNNRKGIVGVNWNTKLIALRVMDANNFTYHSWIIAAIEYIVELLKDSDIKIAALNLSIAGWHNWTPSAAKSESLLWRALNTLDQINRTVIVVAAGNDNSQIGAPATIDFPDVYRKGEYCYPASFTGLNNMIVVGGIHRTERAGHTSNWSVESVHLAAPGADVFSTYPVYVNSSGYGLGDGTSRSAPHVAGAAALVASASPDLTASEIRDILFKSANSSINPEAFVTIEIDGRSVTIYPQGITTKKLSKYGLLDVGKAVALAAGVPTTNPTKPTSPPISGGGGGGCNTGAFCFGAGTLALVVLWSIRKR